MSLPEAYQMALLKIIQQKLREAKSSEEAESILNLDAGGGYCYLRLFADEHQLDAQELGAHPSVAELRRFANSRAQPFGRKKVVVGMGNVMGEVVAHVEYSDGKRAISPAAVLAGLSKQVFVGSGALKEDPLQVRLMQTISDFYAETGARKPKSVEDADKEKEGGYCYLRLFDERHKRDAAACGGLPSAADVRRFANARAAPYGPHRVKVALVEVQGHTVAHVEYSEDVDSLTPLAALSALNKDVLVGMAEVSVVRRSDSTDVATGIGSTMEITPRSNHCRVDLPIGGYLNSTEKDAMTFFPGDIAGFRRAFQLFESVRLIKFSMTATVQGDHSTVLRLAVTANRNPPSNNAGWAAAEGSMTMVGNSNGATVSEFSLPENHQFGRELKGMPMSNHPPTFHFYVTSGGPCHVWFRGTFTLDMSGQGNPSGVNMAGHSYKMQRVFPAHTLTGLGDKEGGPGEETDDDEDDHPDLFKHAKQVSGPVKAGNSGRSSVSPTASRIVQKQ